MENEDVRSMDPGARPIIDYDVSLARLGGSRELFDMLVKLYLEDSAKQHQELQDALAARDARRLVRAAHTLKGLAANFEARAAVDAALQVETAARNGDWDRILAARPALVEAFGRLDQALADFTPAKP